MPWIEDGYCDDINNNIDCDYDGGDCCGPNRNTQYCSVCQCLENVTTTSSTNIPTSNSSIITTIPSFTTTTGDDSHLCTLWVGDGFCDDINNIVQCNFDNGDCCGLNVNTDFCQVCQCLGGGNNTTVSPTTTTGNSSTTTASITVISTSTITSNNTTTAINTSVNPSTTKKSTTSTGFTTNTSTTTTLMTATTTLGNI